MRYAQIRKMDISNGEGIGVALFLQGCHFHCKGCFNPDTWSFEGGKEWTPEIEEQFMKLIEQPQITRISFLGGEPLDQPIELLKLIRTIKSKFPNKKIWLYTGFIFDEINIYTINSPEDSFTGSRYEIVNTVDVIVDGQYEESLRDLTLDFRGSSNQRIIRRT